MTTKDFYTEIQRTADTEGTQINAADVSRVLHLAFFALARMSSAGMCDTLSRCMQAARKKEKC